MTLRLGIIGALTILTFGSAERYRRAAYGPPRSNYSPPVSNYGPPPQPHSNYGPPTTSGYNRPQYGPQYPNNDYEDYTVIRTRYNYQPPWRRHHHHPPPWSRYRGYGNNRWNQYDQSQYGNGGWQPNTNVGWNQNDNNNNNNGFTSQTSGGGAGWSQVPVPTRGGSPGFQVPDEPQPTAAVAEPQKNQPPVFPSGSPTGIPGTDFNAQVQDPSISSNPEPMTPPPPPPPPPPTPPTYPEPASDSQFTMPPGFTLPPQAHVDAIPMPPGK